MAYDYAQRLARGEAECNALIADVLGAHLMSKGRVGGRGSAPPKIETCSLLNVSVCPATETNNVSSCTKVQEALYTPSPN